VIPVEAAHWISLPGQAVRCELCPLGCRLVESRDGPCGSRGNRGGRMVPLEYGRLVSAAMDPIEKKPLYHFHPGAPILSIAALGCNLHCQFCQNWTISQRHDGRPGGAGAGRRSGRGGEGGGERGGGHETRDRRAKTGDATPAQVVALARDQGSVGIAYTYSEPLVWFEFVRDTAALARAAGLRNVIVTNGFLNEAPLRELLPLIDAANVDLKAMDDAFYRKVCKARLEPVLRTLRLCRELGVHLEVTNLVIPGWNDRDDQLAALVDFVAGLGRGVPLHFSAYRPAYRFEAPPTPSATLARAAALARGQLDFVYVGNVHVPGTSDTLCPGCGATVIERAGYRARSRLGPDGACPDCGRSLPVVAA
jgi:pyruvate formate lyase activating enzyme